MRGLFFAFSLLLPACPRAQTLSAPVPAAEAIPQPWADAEARIFEQAGLEGPRLTDDWRLETASLLRDEPGLPLPAALARAFAKTYRQPPASVPTIEALLRGRLDARPMLAESVYRAFPLPDGRLFASTGYWQHAALFLKGEGAWTKQEVPFPDNLAQHIEQIGGTLYAASADGIHERKDGRWRRTSEERSYHLLKTERGPLAASTYGVYHPSLGKWRLIPGPKGVGMHNVFEALHLAEREGKIYVSTTEGLYVGTPRKGLFDWFPRYDWVLDFQEWGKRRVHFTNGFSAGIRFDDVPRRVEQSLWFEDKLYLADATGVHVREGEGWSKVLDKRGAERLAVIGGRLHAVADGQVWAKDGDAWVRAFEFPDASELRVHDLVEKDGLVFASTNGGLFRFEAAPKHPESAFLTGLGVPAAAPAPQNPSERLDGSDGESVQNKDGRTIFSARAMRLICGTLAAFSIANSACGEATIHAAPTPEMAARLQENAPHVEHILSRLKGPGATRDALEDARRMAKEMYGRVRPEIAGRLDFLGLQIVVVPWGKQLWDVEELQSLKGEPAPYGDPWSSIGGISRLPDPDGRYIVGMHEEKILQGPRANSDFRQGGPFVHELAHPIWVALNPGEIATIQALYKERKENGWTLPTDHATFAVQEYFAESVAAYFDALRPYGARSGPAWLQAHDRRMYDVLLGIFGPNEG